MPAFRVMSGIFSVTRVAGLGYGMWGWETGREKKTLCLHIHSGENGIAMGTDVALGFLKSSLGLQARVFFIFFYDVCNHIDFLFVLNVMCVFLLFFFLFLDLSIFHHPRA